MYLTPVRAAWIRHWATTVLVSLTLGLVGCAARHPPQAAVSPEKPPIGVVALVLPESAAIGHFQRPGVVGRGQGARNGAKTGARAAFMPGIGVLAVSAEARSGHGAVLGLMLLGAGVVLSPFTAGIGAGVGALAAPKQEDVERNEASLAGALDDARVAESLAARIVDAAGSRPIVPSVLVHPDSELPAVDTYLELDEIRVSLASKDPTDWKPQLRLRLSVHGRLVRASDGEEIRTWRWNQDGCEARLVEWAKDSARLLREDLDRAVSVLAVRIIEDLF